MNGAYLDALTRYGVARGLIAPEDVCYGKNRLLELLRLDEAPAEGEIDAPLHEILRALTDDAVRRGLIDDTVTARDLFDTALMGALTPYPHEVRAEFARRYAVAPEAATDWFYQFSQDTNYIRRDRIARDVKWKYASPYGELDITINLSKPEKDPRDIAAARAAPQSGYPRCALCAENEGYAGRVNHPARQNLRVQPIFLNGSPWYLQYSPYVYYNEHCIALNAEHRPMHIDGETFRRLLDFVTQFPHYFIGSNADLPIVGGSIFRADAIALRWRPRRWSGRLPLRPFRRFLQAWCAGRCRFCACEARSQSSCWRWRSEFSHAGANIPTRRPAFWPRRTACRTTRSRPSPAAAARITKWIWCCAATSPQSDILWACFIRTRSCITSKRKTSA